MRAPMIVKRRWQDDVVRRYAWLQDERVELAPGEAGYEACDDGDRLLMIVVQKRVREQSAVMDLFATEMLSSVMRPMRVAMMATTKTPINVPMIARLLAVATRSRRFRTVDGEQQELRWGRMGTKFAMMETRKMAISALPIA